MAKRGRKPGGRLSHGGLKNPVRKMVVAAGGLVRVCHILPVTPASLHGWLRKRRVPQTRSAVLLAHLCGVPMDMKVVELAGLTRDDLARLMERAAMADKIKAAS